MFQDPHHPPCRNDSSDEQCEAVGAVADHLARGVALRDAEDDAGKQRKNDGGGKMRKV